MPEAQQRWQGPATEHATLPLIILSWGSVSAMPTCSCLEGPCLPATNFSLACPLASSPPLRPFDIMLLSSDGNGLAAAWYGGAYMLQPTIRVACTLPAPCLSRCTAWNPYGTGLCTQQDAAPKRQMPAPTCSHCTAGRPVAMALWRGWRSAMMAIHSLETGAPQTAR